MKKSIHLAHILFCAYFLITGPLLQAKDIPLKVKEAQEAGETWLNWHFFENGRGMTLTPNLTRFMWMIKSDPKNETLREESSDPVKRIIENRYGLIYQDKKLMGIFNVKYKGMDLGVLGCTACHSGRAAGRLIPGLGNKTIDPAVIGKDSYRIQKFWGITSNNPEFKKLHAKAMNFAKVTADEKLGNLTKGLVADAFINTFFFKDQGLPYPKDMARGQVKVPHLWGVKEKREVGLFNDGALSGDSYAWAFGAELMASDSGDHMRAVLPQIRWVVDEVLGKLLPPDYPYAIDQQAAIRGKKLYNRSCQKCHGDHDRDHEGLPVYDAPEIISINEVKTDSEKLDLVQDDFVQLVKTGSVGDLLTFNDHLIRYGYFAPKLWGIWSRFPYLHNGSVPSVYHLLLPPSIRPEVFSMEFAGEEYRFDQEKLGLSTYTQTQDYQKALSLAKKGERNIYFTQRPGHSNQGHYFSSFSEFGQGDRMDIIEYLKTL